MGEKEREKHIEISQRGMSDSEHKAFEAFLESGNNHLKEVKEMGSRPWTTCFITFLNMLLVFGDRVKQLNFSKPFRIVIDYDPEQVRVAIRHYSNKEASESSHPEME